MSVLWAGVGALCSSGSSLCASIGLQTGRVRAGQDRQTGQAVPEIAPSSGTQLKGILQASHRALCRR